MVPNQRDIAQIAQNVLHTNLLLQVLNCSSFRHITCAASGICKMYHMYMDHESTWKHEQNEHSSFKYKHIDLQLNLERNLTTAH